MLTTSENRRQSTQQSMDSPQCEFSRHGQDHTQDVEQQVTRPVRIGTSRLHRLPAALHIHRQGDSYLEPGGSVTLQFLPSGICFPASLAEPMILGRMAFDEHQSFDLARIGAYRHGVSRQHCALRRDGSRLIVTDLNSTNGTYLNGERLIPWQDFVLGVGARLVLGTLHVTIYFVQDVGQ